MACKPPWTSIAKVRPGSPRQTASRHAAAGASVPGNTPRPVLACAQHVEAPLWLFSGGTRGAELPVRTPSATCGRWQRNAVGRCRRNAAGRGGVKLEAAPDAPHRGEVLVRTPTDQVVSARRRAILTFICPSREFPVCPALAKDLGAKDIRGLVSRPGWPVSCGGDRRRWQTLTRQRAAGCRGSRDPHPGKDPL
jgi:hypothetical protein